MSSVPKSIEDAKKMKLEDAIELLEEAAKSKGNELKNMLQSRYENIESAVESIFGADIGDLISGASESLKGAAAKSRKFVERTAAGVDDSVHSNPWSYIGGGLALGLVVGFLMGKK